MKNVAIITEYNPFHNGHKYQLDMIRQSGAENIIVCMNGNFTQRCSPSVVEKHVRAEVSVNNGADLVIELPFVFGTASAEQFAFGGVFVLESLGLVDTLCFGSEYGSLEVFDQVLSALDIAERGKLIPQYMKSGISYPAARQKAIAACGCEFVIAKPNDVLALEYIKAIKKIGSGIKPFTIKRIGEYNSDISVDNIMSAGGIRSLFVNGFEYEKYLPYDMYSAMKTAKENGSCSDNKKFELLLLAEMRKLFYGSNLDFSKINGISEGLENRILKYSNSSTLQELFEKVKTKRYTMSAVRRAVFSLFFGLRKKYDKPSYIHVLAFNNKGRRLLRHIKKEQNVKIFHTLPNSVSENYFFTKECMATDIWTLTNKLEGPGGSEFIRGSVYVDKF